MRKEDLINEFAVTEEYKAWQESLLAIIGYSKNEEVHDEELITDFIADHINRSLELSKALERIEMNLKENEKSEENKE